MDGMKSVVLCAALVLAGTTAIAQQAPVRDQTGGRYESDKGYDSPQSRNGPQSEARREEVRKKVETVRMWRLTEALKLDEKTSTKLAALLSALDQKRRTLMRENGQIIKDLRVLLTAGTPNEQKLRAKLDVIEQNQRERMSLREKEIAGIKELLSVEQQARYFLFQQEFRSDMRGMIAGARGNGPKPGNMNRTSEGK